MFYDVRGFEKLHIMTAEVHITHQLLHRQYHLHLIINRCLHAIKKQLKRR